MRISVRMVVESIHRTQNYPKGDDYLRVDGEVFEDHVSIGELSIFVKRDPLGQCPLTIGQKLLVTIEETLA